MSCTGLTSKLRRSFATSCTAGPPAQPHHSPAAPPWRTASGPTTGALLPSLPPASRRSRVPSRGPPMQASSPPRPSWGTPSSPSAVSPYRPSPTVIKPSRRTPRALPTFPGLTPCPAPGPSVPPASSSRLAHNGTATPRRRTSKNRRAWPQSRHAAARHPGGTGVTRVQSACDTRAWRGRRNRSDMPAGPGGIPSSNATRARHPRPPCARSRARGSACCFGVGTSARRLTRRSLSLRATAEGHPCSTIWHRRPKKASKDLDSPPQSMCSARSSRHVSLPWFAPHAYWITSSAWNKMLGGIVRPMAWAVFRLRTSSNFIGCSIGRSPGFAPLRILST